MIETIEIIRTPSEMKKERRIVNLKSKSVLPNGSVKEVWEIMDQDTWLSRMMK